MGFLVTMVKTCGVGFSVKSSGCSLVGFGLSSVGSNEGSKRRPDGVGYLVPVNVAVSNMESMSIDAKKKLMTSINDYHQNWRVWGSQWRLLFENKFVSKYKVDPGIRRNNNVPSKLRGVGFAVAPTERRFVV